jgi:hypothetical protein
MPSNRWPQRAASNHAHEQVVIVFRGFVRVRRFEAAYRLVLLRPALAREYMNMIMVRKDYSVRSSKPNPCMPGLGQGHGRKRHLQAKIVMQVRGIVLMHDKTGAHVRSSFSNKGGLDRQLYLNSCSSDGLPSFPGHPG